MFLAIFLAEINFWWHFKIPILKVHYLKVPSKGDFGQKKIVKNMYFGFFAEKVSLKNPKYRVFGLFLAEINFWGHF